MSKTLVFCVRCYILEKSCACVFTEHHVPLVCQAVGIAQLYFRTSVNTYYWKNPNENN